MVVLFIALFKVVLTLASLNGNLVSGHLNVLVIEQQFPVPLIIKLYKVASTWKSVDETPACNHSNESYWAVFSCATDSLRSQWLKPQPAIIQMKAIEHYFYVIRFILLYMYKMVLTFKCVNESVLCDYSTESWRAVRLCGTVWKICGWNPDLRLKQEFL